MKALLAILSVAIIVDSTGDTSSSRHRRVGPGFMSVVSCSRPTMATATNRRLPSAAHHAIFAAALLLAGALALLPGLDRASADEPSANTIAIGRQLAQLARAGDVEAIVGLFEVHDVTCPGTDFDHVCDGVEAGTVVDGYRAGSFRSEWGFISADDLRAGLQADIDRFATHDFELFTVANTGDGDCLRCTVAVVSTPAEVAGDAPVAMFMFQITPGSPARVFSLTAGSVGFDEEELVIVRGGGYSGWTFIRVDLLPPRTGVGLGPEGARVDVHWLLLAAVLVALPATVAALRRR